MHALLGQKAALLCADKHTVYTTIHQLIGGVHVHACKQKTAMYFTINTKKEPTNSKCQKVKRIDTLLLPSSAYST